MADRPRRLSLSLVIAGKELRQRVRDRSAIIQAIVAPLALALIIGTTFGGSSGRFHATIAVADLDHGPVARAFVDRVLRSPDLRRTIAVKPAASVEAARALIRSNDVGAAFVLPPGLSSAVQSGATTRVEVIHNGTEPITGDVADSIAASFGDRTNAVVLAVRTAIALGTATTPAAIAAVATRAASAPAPVQLNDVALQGNVIKPGAFFGPAMAIFFLFGTLSVGIRSLLIERRSGTLERLLASPVPRPAIIAGKALATFITGLVAMTVLVVASEIFLGASFGDPFAVALLSLAVVISLMGLASLVCLAARTEEQAGTIGALTGMILALAGGNFMPAGTAPHALRIVSLFTPNGWALRAFTELGAGGRLGAITTNLLVLVGIGVVTGGIAASRANRIVAA